MQVMTTLGVDYSAKNLAGPGQTTIRLNLWDVAGFLKNWQNQITKMVNGDGIGHDLIKKNQDKSVTEFSLGLTCEAARLINDPTQKLTIAIDKHNATQRIT